MILMNNNSMQDESGFSEVNVANNFSEVCFDILESVTQAIIVVVIALSFVVKIVSVKGWSMLNTLRDADRLVVMKWNYKPQNGDVVVIKRGQNLDEPIVKRIIATEGQTVSIDFTTGTVRVDGKPLNEKYIREVTRLQGDAENPQVVPQGYCYVMGDNRNHSMDSRFKDVGLIPYDYIVGKAQWIVYPFNRFGGID